MASRNLSQADQHSFYQSQEGRRGLIIYAGSSGGAGIIRIGKEFRPPSPSYKWKLVTNVQLILVYVSACIFSTDISDSFIESD